MRFAFLALLVAPLLGAGCSCQTDLGSLDGGTDGGPDGSILDGGSADAGRCIAASVGSFTLDNYDDVSVRYRARISPELSGDPFDLYIEMNRYLDAEYVGTFPLGPESGPDGNFGTCAHCVVAFYGSTFEGALFAEAGTLTLRADPFDLRLSAILEGLRIAEVTIEGDDLHSVPVPNGVCLTFDRIEVEQPFAPPGWTCSADLYGDGATCDCRCGPPDTDCYDSSLPIAGCTADQRCIARLEGPVERTRCVDACDRASGETCPGDDVCVDDFVGDLCVGDEALLDRDAVVGDPCAEGAVYCAIEGPTGGPGLAQGYCDFDRQGGRCSPRCHVDADCDASIFERCYTIGSNTEPGGEKVFYGFCSPRYPSDWTCGGGDYEDGAICHCGCGPIDPDCYSGTLPITGCDAGEVCVPDGSCAPVPANDTCATALPLTAGTITGTTTGGTNDYTHVRDAGGCIDVEEDAPDVVYAVSLSAGQTLTVVGQALDFNIALYLIGPGAPAVCDRTSSACVAGAEVTEHGEAETLSYTASTAGTYYLVVDSFASERMGPFELTTTLSP